MKNKYKIDIDNNIVLIAIKNHHIGTIYSKVDLDDFNKINMFRTTWHVTYKNNRIDGVRTKIQKHGKRKQVWLHRLITNCPSNMVVDHINGDTLDNRKCNLRIVTQAENATNLSSYSNNKSGYTNIYIEKDGKYRVRINRKSFGRYNDLETAVKIRNKNIKDIFELRER